jgi:hypothetical protein
MKALYEELMMRQAEKQAQENEIASNVLKLK